MQASFGKRSKVNVRLESIKAAFTVASPHDDVANLLVHADWVASYILAGKSPAVGTMAESPPP